MARRDVALDYPTLTSRSGRRTPRVVSTSLSEYLFAFLNQPWRKEGACVGRDSDVFFPERGEPNTDAMAICSGCGVRVECLTYAMETTGVEYGIWGGLLPSDREAVKVMVKRGVKVHQAMAAVDLRRSNKRQRQILKAGKGRLTGVITDPGNQVEMVVGRKVGSAGR